MFTASDCGFHGDELWVTDGTSSGTSELKDIFPGGSSSHINNLTALGNGSALFGAADGITGYELWITDGTAAGTSVLKDINTAAYTPGPLGEGTGGSHPGSMVAIGDGRALFDAHQSSTGSELWVSNGTAAGTSLVMDIKPGPGSSGASFVTPIGNGKALFTSDDGVTGDELWVTDGTSAGTSLVKDVNPGAAGSYPSGLKAVGDGTVLFEARDGENGIELWVTDGTSAGTSLVDNIYPGPVSYASPGPPLTKSTGNSFPGFFAVLPAPPPRITLFAAQNGATGNEFWVTDGTAPGASLVADINPGTAGSSPFGLTAIGNHKEVFRATNGSSGYELWVSDGTSFGTSIVKDINPGTASSGPEYMSAFGAGRALFDATDGVHGYELWITDGTSAGTSLVKDINPGGSSARSPLTDLGNGKALFAATDGVHGYEPWVTDGTSTGTSMLLDVNPGSGNSTGYAPVSLGSGLAVFGAVDTGGMELWVTNGTSAGTSRLTTPGTIATATRLAALGNGKVLFSAFDGANSTGQELWVTDGTAGGTSRVTEIYPGTTGSYPKYITPLGDGRAVFEADGTSATGGLWVTDGTASGTSFIKDIFPYGGHANPGDLTALGNGKVVFRASNGQQGQELWVTDGTPSGTSLVRDILPGPGGSHISGLTAPGDGTALFNATDGTSGYEVWTTDGTAGGTYQVKDINPGINGSFPTSFAVVVPCFVSGTNIATADGPVQVQHLRPGARVRTVLGGSGDVVWIGRRTVDCGAHPKPETVWPIRVSRDAFGPGLPIRDLYLSPDHAVYVNSVLIPIKLLINGTTVRQVEQPSVTYYHVELAQHDVVLAEGLPAESYLDTGDRARFTGGGTVTVLHPDFSARTWEMEGCAQLVLVGPILHAVREDLRQRAARSGRRIARQLKTVAEEAIAHRGSGWRRRDASRAGLSLSTARASSI